MLNRRESKNDEKVAIAVVIPSKAMRLFSFFSDSLFDNFGATDKTATILYAKNPSAVNGIDKSPNCIFAYGLFNTELHDEAPLDESPQIFYIPSDVNNFK